MKRREKANKSRKARQSYRARKTRQLEKEEQEYYECPVCFEDVHYKYVICPHCGSKILGSM